MKKIKIMTKKFAVFCIICVPFAGSRAQSEKIEDKITSIKRAPVIKMSLEEEIQYLHKKIPDLVKKLKLQDKPDIILDMGAMHKTGQRAKYVYVEKASLKLAGESLSELVFIYEQSNDAGTYKESRELINKSPSDQSCKDLKVIYKTSKGELDEFTLNVIENEMMKTRVLRMYLDCLNSFVRWMEFYAKKGVVDQDKTIHRALRISVS